MESGGNSAETVEFETQRSKSSTLQDHLLWQVELTSFSERDHAIAMAIIDSINADGYLISSPEEIFQGMLDQLDDLEFDEVNAVLHRIQNFDPAGVAAIDLKDCLKLQLQQLPEATRYKEEALILVTRYLDLLATHEQSKLMIECRKLYFSDIIPEHFMVEGIHKNYPKKDYHRMYIGEIISCFDNFK